MNREEALTALKSSASHQRLEAARFFIVNGDENDLLALRQARQAETDTYVCKRLNQAIEKVSSIVSRQAGTAQPDEIAPQRPDILAKAIEVAGGLLLHEMEGPIGRASLYASNEMQNYTSSKTKKEIDALKRVFVGIEQLVKATKPPRPQQFDLANLIEETVSTEIKAGLNPSLYGAKPFLAVTDQDLLRMALANGLRNAAESVELVGSSDHLHPIVVTWGDTDRDYWISIIDRGLGITGTPSSKFEVGKTTKQGHRGFGLAVAKRAMESIDGTVSLQPGTDGGASYELRWKRQQ